MKEPAPLNGGHRQVHLEATSGAVLAILADIHGKEAIKQEDLWEIREAADKYLFVRLKTEVERRLTIGLSSKNLLDFLRNASLFR